MNETYNPAKPDMGWLFLGMTVTLFLYGVGLAQTYQYVRRPEGLGRWWIKYWLAGLFFFNTLHTVNFPYFLYIHLAVDHSDTTIASFYKATWAVPLGTALTGVVEAFAQFFFAWRVHLALRHRLLTAAIVMLSCIACLGSIGAAIAVIEVPNYDEWESRLSPLIVTWLGIDLVVNNTISISLIHHLIKTRKTCTPVTEHMVNHFLSMAIATGVLTSMNTIASFVVFLIGGPEHLIFEMPMSTLYTNSVLAMLGSGYQFSDRKRESVTQASGVPVFTTVFTNTVQSDDDIELRRVNQNFPMADDRN